MADRSGTETGETSSEGTAAPVATLTTVTKRVRRRPTRATTAATPAPAAEKAEQAAAAKLPSQGHAAATNLRAPEYYLNRELTWLSFNKRVLHEARDKRTPLLERLKFLAIASSNLDEFFMKRIGGLKQQVCVIPLE